MNIRTVTQVATAIALGFVTTISFIKPSYGGGSKFYCAVLNDVPITWVRTSRGKEPFIRWASDAFDVSPLQRCKIVSARFRRYYDNGRFYFTGREDLNGYPVLCISERPGGGCSSQNILVTLKKGSDPGFIIQQILYFRRGAAKEPIIELSGDKFIQYVDGEFYLDVKKLIDKTP
ncbi:COP23 domain-containing protein [Mastigocoleus sp. MO_188.B34]|uniref:COP23 domain-containing protein n=1 Tax=Mastigocoleus sp. MO_188.B34 TaxID=3036635 RepID=UPI0026149D78|nr:COP23 domain-containing protein [Mastigocoleus sp. MO_188.B34]MDJ0693593.1 COP23 domain-containing protein [Mastigocoleus sp. MO_188.B34]